MGLTFNTNNITGMTFNGQTVRRCFFNGASVFPALTKAATQPTSAMTSNTKPSPYTAYYSSRYTDTYAAYKAFTNAISTQGWASCSNNKDGTAWIALDLGSGKLLRDVKVSLWNRDAASANGPYNVTIYGTNTTPTNGGGTTFTEMPADAVPLGVFSGLVGGTRKAAAVLDCVGDETSGCTRDTAYIRNRQNYGFRYIIISSTSWNQAGGTYMAIGCIKIDGNFES